MVEDGRHLAKHRGGITQMKLVMMTPGVLPSAIGRMVRMVTRALLAHGCEVLIVRTESADLKTDEAHDFGTQTVHWSDTVVIEQALVSADAVIYQIGDYFDYHEGGIYWLARQRGIVCLHDFFLGHLFTAWAQLNRKLANSILEYWYDFQIAKSYFEYNSSEDFIEGTRQNSPMVEWVVSQASAVICHSNWGIDRVLNACPGPVHVVPLAYEGPVGVNAVTLQPSSGGCRFQILTVGHVNPNKRADSVIRAIGASEQLRNSATYTLVGAVQPDVKLQLESLAASLGVDLRVCGEVSTAGLAQALQQADMVCCLRRPTLEAASASTIEAMLSGRAVIVEDVGFYAELPDDCVRKIRPQYEEDDLRFQIEDLATDPTGRRALGERAARWAQATFTADNYALQLAKIVKSSRRCMLVISTMQVFVHQLAHWGNSQRLMTLPESVDPIRIFESGN